MNHEDVIATIQGLLNMTVDRGDSPGEQKNAAAAAQRLLLKHGLDMKQVQQAAEHQGIGQAKVNATSREIASGIAALLEGIEFFFTVEVIHETYPLNRDSSTFLFIGGEVNTTLATWLFTKVKKELYRHCLAELPTVRHLPRKERKRFQESFLEGAAFAVMKRLKAARLDAMDSMQGADTLVVNERDALARYIKAEFGKLRKPRSPKPSVDSTEGLRAGQRVGNEISIDVNAIEPRPNPVLLLERRSA